MKTFHTFSSLSLSHDNGQVLTVLEFPGSDVWVRLLHGHVGRLRDPPDHQDSQVGVCVVDNVVDGGVGDAVDEDGDPKKVNLRKKNPSNLSFSLLTPAFGLLTAGGALGVVCGGGWSYQLEENIVINVIITIKASSPSSSAAAPTA